MMEKRENGQALVDFLLLLVVLIGIPLVLIFRCDAQLRNVSARAVRTVAGVIRNWRGGPRRPAQPCKTVPADKTDAKTPAASPAAAANPETPAASPADKDAKTTTTPAAAPAR